MAIRGISLRLGIGPLPAPGLRNVLSFGLRISGLHDQTPNDRYGVSSASRLSTPAWPMALGSFGLMSLLERLAHQTSVPGLLVGVPRAHSVGRRLHKSPALEH